MLKQSIIGLALIAGALASSPALAAQAAATRGAATADTVNSYAPAQERRARAVATRLGYSVGPLVMAQDGNHFFNATKDGKTTQVTVTREGQAYAGLAGPPAPPAPPPAARPAAPAAPAAPR